MTKEELNKKLAADQYHIKRQTPTDAEIRLYLREVDYHCPICGKELQSRKQKKKDQKMFEIAHIYPNRPTIEQYEALHGLERLGDNSESFENKISICKDCHSTQDYHTTSDEYLKLLSIKKHCLTKTALHDATKTLGLEDDIRIVIQKIKALSTDEVEQLQFKPVHLANKITKENGLLKTKISGYVLQYYPFIMDCFQQIDGKNGFNQQVLAEQIRSCFIKMCAIKNDQTMIFSSIVEWLMQKTSIQSIEACEAVVSFFVQSCEVFYEITE